MATEAEQLKAILAQLDNVMAGTLTPVGIAAAKDILGKNAALIAEQEYADKISIEAMRYLIAIKKHQDTIEAQEHHAAQASPTEAIQGMLTALEDTVNESVKNMSYIELMRHHQMLAEYEVAIYDKAESNDRRFTAHEQDILAGSKAKRKDIRAALLSPMINMTVTDDVAETLQQLDKMLSLHQGLQQTGLLDKKDPALALFLKKAEVVFQSLVNNAAGIQPSHIENMSENAQTRLLQNLVFESSRATGRESDRYLKTAEQMLLGGIEDAGPDDIGLVNQMFNEILNRNKFMANLDPAHQQQNEALYARAVIRAASAADIILAKHQDNVVTANSLHEVQSSGRVSAFVAGLGQILTSPRQGVEMLKQSLGANRAEIESGAERHLEFAALKILQRKLKNAARHVDAQRPAVASDEALMASVQTEAAPATKFEEQYRQEIQATRAQEAEPPATLLDQEKPDGDTPKGPRKKN